MRSGCHLVLIRHAHTEANNLRSPGALLCGQSHTPLTPLGVEQVERLRRRMAHERAGGLYSSHLERARRTAGAAPAGLASDLRVLRSLAEINCGYLDGMPLHEVRAKYPELWERNLAQNEEHFRWPGGESYSHFRRRALRAIRRISERHRGDRAILVTHAGLISTVLGFLAGTNPAEWSKFRPGNASITEIRWNGNEGEVLVFDDRSHLNGLHSHRPAAPSTPPFASAQALAS